MVHQVRVRGRFSLQRVLLPSALSTFQDLQIQIFDLFHVDPKDQKLSTTPLAKPNFITSPSLNHTLQQLNIQNGDMIYLGGEKDEDYNGGKAKQIEEKKEEKEEGKSSASVSSSSSLTSSLSSLSTSSSSSSRKLTPRCQHGPNGACPHCMPSSDSPSSSPSRPHCNHPASATCIHCSEYVAKKSTDPAAWLCNHPDTVFCPKCLPPLDPSAPPAALRCDCDKNKGQECIKCVDKGPLIKVDVIPYSQYLQKKKAMCKFKHPPTTSCFLCLPEPFPNFKGKVNCDKGHAPWPIGSCLSCSPPNANLRLQPYRHTDSISMEAKVIQNFYSAAKRKQNIPRAAILLGKYVDEGEETKNEGAIRALVYALYEPPQEYSEKNGVKFLNDEREKTVHDVSSRMGLEPVGWVVTSQPREGEKYGGKVLLSGTEVRQAARFQLRYSSPSGFSRFVTILIEHKKDEVEPRAFQVSDMAVALEESKAFEYAEDPNMLSTREPQKKEMISTIVYKDRPLLPGREFLPDELLVKVNIFAPRTSSTPFIRAEVPSNAGAVYLNSYFTQYKATAWEDKLSDFNLLVALYHLLKNDIVLEIADAIGAKKAIRQQTITTLTQLLQQNKII